MKDFHVAIPVPAFSKVQVPTGLFVPRWRWLRWALNRLGLLEMAFYQNTHQYTKIVEIKTGCLREFLWKHTDTLFRSYNERITDVYLGRDHFKTFLADFDDTNSTTMGTFKVSLEMVLRSDRAFSTQAWGVRVHFIPWFEGILAVPATSKHLLQEPH